MPHPDFTGTVPHRRCETCRYWQTNADNDPALTVAVGECRVPSRAPLITLDLAVCSLWHGTDKD